LIEEFRDTCSFDTISDIDFLKLAGVSQQTEGAEYQMEVEKLDCITKEDLEIWRKIIRYHDKKYLLD